MSIQCPNCRLEQDYARVCVQCGGLLIADPDETTIHQKSQTENLGIPGDRNEIRVKCPHCRYAIAIVGNESEGDIACPSCHESFRIDADRTQTWTPEKLPRVGKYRLIRRVGRGAFGAVYAAFDTELEREVAVKIPRNGTFDTPDDENRFLREARNAAKLSHPNIVRVFDSGHTGEFPYIVSEFVAGATLADMLLNRPYTPQESADLIATVAEAVEHAHRHGVVHRDLKPGNIMIDLAGKPRIMDFGLAKRDRGEITMTVEGNILGTPAYMSPEQARGDSATADARSDVYSLGVILFELLTGERPFRGSSTMLMHAVLNLDPPNPRSLNDRIPRDLETIGLKCLQKDPSRRYPTAQQLADDLRRHLRNEPIVARPIGRLERTVRWCQRNPVIARSAATVAVTLMTALIVVSYFWRHERAAHATASKLAADNRRLYVQEKEARVMAQASQRDALRRFRDARRTVDLSLTEFSDALRLFPGVDEARRRVLTRAAEEYDRFVQEKGASRDLELERVRAYKRLAVVYRELNDPEKAERYLRSAMELLKTLETADHDKDSQLEAATAHVQLGLLIASQGRLDEARSEYAAATAGIRPLLRNSPDDPSLLDGLATALVDSATLLAQMGEIEDAAAAAADAESCFEKLAARDPSLARYSFGRAIAQDVMAQIYDRRGMHVDAADSLRRAIATLEKLSQRDPDHVDYVETRAESKMRLAEALQSSGHASDSLAALTAAAEDLELLVATRPGTPAYEDRLAMALVNLGMVHAEEGETSAARKHLERARAIFGGLIERYPFEAGYLAHHAASTQALGNVLSDLDENPAARDLLEQAVRQWSNLQAAVPASLDFREQSAVASAHLGRLLHKLGEHDSAAHHMKASVAEFEQLNLVTHGIPAYRDEGAHACYRLGLLLTDMQRPDEAKACFARARQMWDDVTAGPDAVPQILLSYTRCLVDCRNPAFADSAAALRLATRAAALSPQNNRYQSVLGHAQARAGQWDEAWKTLEQSLGAQGIQNARDGFYCSMVLARLGKSSEAQEAWRAADAWMKTHQPGNVDLKRLRGESAAAVGFPESGTP